MLCVDFYRTNALISRNIYFIKILSLNLNVIRSNILYDRHFCCSTKRCFYCFCWCFQRSHLNLFCLLAGLFDALTSKTDCYIVIILIPGFIVQLFAIQHQVNVVCNHISNCGAFILTFNFFFYCCLNLFGYFFYR